MTQERPVDAMTTDYRALPSGYIDPGHKGEDLALLETFYRACLAEGGTVNEIELRGIRAVLATHSTPQPPADGEVGALVERLKELAHATTKENWREFDMRLPAEPLRDADLVLTRAALARFDHPTPQPPADGEVAELVEWVGKDRQWLDLRRDVKDRILRIADLLQRQHLQPEGGDIHYAWELHDAEGDWQAGGSAITLESVRREGNHYLQTYSQDGPHTLIIQRVSTTPEAPNV